MPVKQQPPIKVGDLIEGAKYRLRVYSHEHHDISSQSFTFETGTGETTPPAVPAPTGGGGLLSWQPLRADGTLAGTLRRGERAVLRRFLREMAVTEWKCIPPV